MTKAEAAEDTLNHPNDQFFVTCQSDQLGAIPGEPAYFNLYYNYSDLRKGIIHHRPTPISDETAISECKKSIIENLKYPSSIKDVSLIRYGANGTDNNLVVYNFTALNGFGNRVPQKGSCIIDPDNRIDVSITNR